MIKSFKHKGLAELFKSASARKVQPKHVQRLKLILTMLNAAANTGWMNAPELRMHPLKGKPAGRYAVWADENYRVTYRVEVGHGVEVDHENFDPSAVWFGGRSPTEGGDDRRQWSTRTRHHM